MTPVEIAAATLARSIARARAASEAAHVAMTSATYGAMPEAALSNGEIATRYSEALERVEDAARAWKEHAELAMTIQTILGEIK